MRDTSSAPLELDSTRAVASSSLSLASASRAMESAWNATRESAFLLGDCERSAMLDLRRIDSRAAAAGLTLNRAAALASAACGSSSDTNCDSRWAAAVQLAGCPSDMPSRSTNDNAMGSAINNYEYDRSAYALENALEAVDGICDVLMADLVAGPQLVQRVDDALSMLADAEHQAEVLDNEQTEHVDRHGN